ncbi:MAG: vanomycin resistance protein VanB, partial [Chloroflexaceae bacterium]|nr:vanomycin resistance protein VanB [Chloroflexaceae bacterium]
MSDNDLQHGNDAAENQHGGGCFRRLLLLPIVLLVLLAGLASITLYTFDQHFANRIYPNISIRGIDVGEMTADEAHTAVTEQYTNFLTQPMTLTYRGQTWTPAAADIGVSLEVARAVQEAVAAGRDNDLLNNLREFGAIWQGGLEIPLHITVDTATMQAYIVARAAEIERPAVDAQFVLQDAQPVAIPSVAGRQVLVNETVADMTAALQSLEPQSAVLRTRELLPLLGDGKVAAVQAEVDALLQASVVLIGQNEQRWEWTPDQLAQLITVRRIVGKDGVSPDLELNFDNVRLREWIAAVVEESGYGGTKPRVDWNGGNLVITEPGANQWRVDGEQTAQMILAALDAKATDRTIELPYVESEPPINASNLAQLGITTLLAVGQSDFTGSAAYRITNIQAGMRLLDDILLAPGEEFSFNNTVGSIDASNGFVEGYAIIQNRTQLEWGGGICQDSTTIFRAAFWAGLPFTERWGHSFYISWYDRYGYGSYGDGPGMDATIFTGGPDLRFVNDTGNWILIQTGVDVGSALAEVRIYGAPSDRTVELIGPRIYDRKPAPSDPVFVASSDIARGGRRQSDTARGGMSIGFTRVVLEGGTETRRDNFTTVFKPWPNIYEVHPDDLASWEGRATPSPTPEETDTPETAPVAPAEDKIAEQPQPTAPPAEQPPAEHATRRATARR